MESRTTDNPEGFFRKRLNKILNRTHHHFSCYLPEHIGGLPSLLLKLFYSGIKLDENQSAVLEKLEPDAIVVYVNKFKSKFEYLFYYERYKDGPLPAPQIGFDYKIVFWQPISRMFKIMLAKFDFFLLHRKLPCPYASNYIRHELSHGTAGFLSLIGKKSFYRRFVKDQIDPVQYLIEFQKTTDQPIYIIPQLIFFSKNPHRANPTIIDVFFGPEDKPGRIRRLVTLFKNPGKVFVELSQPVNLKKFLASAVVKDNATEYQSLVLRRDLLLQLNRHRQSITGPILKSRQELKESILTADRLQDFLNKYAEKREMPIHEVRRKADSYIEEIAANYNPSFLKMYSAIVGWILNTMFDGTSVNNEILNRAKAMALKGPLIFIPSHKSHIDYLILSYLLYHNNMPCPHVAAGKNLSFWPIGPLFRAGGAFFLRRSFRGAALYAKVFAGYIHKLLEEGFNIELFIEGGRSRTGKLLMPKLGLLSILINAYRSGACDDMILVPTYIGYDRILEEKSYLHELEGGKKESESLFQVIRARKFLKKRYGKIYIQFHEPISMHNLLVERGTPIADMKPKEQNALVRDLGYQITNAINRVTVVTPHALVAGAMLNSSKNRFVYDRLLWTIDTYLTYLGTTRAQLSDSFLIDPSRSIEHVVEAYIQRKFIEPLSKIDDDPPSARRYAINESKRPFLEYYKNNIIAFFIPAAYTALAILQRDAFLFSAADLHHDYRLLQELFKFDFVKEVDRTEEFSVRKTIKAFIDDGILSPHQTMPDTYNLTSAGLRKLKLFSRFLRTYFESYWVVLSYFMRNPQKSIKTKDRLKKIESRGARMYKRKEIEHQEALSKINFQNAVEFFSGCGIKGADDVEEIEYYTAVIQKALKYLQS